MEPEKSTNSSFLSRAADLVGCLAGPPDLSNAEVYLEDFGNAEALPQLEPTA